MHLLRRLPMILLSLGSPGLVGCGFHPYGAPVAAARRADLDLGTIRPGGVARRTWRCVNPTADAWAVVRVETSCPCLRVEPTAFAVAPGAAVTLAVTCDLATEPEFRGALAVEVVARGAADRPVWTRHVAVTVAD